LTRGMDRAGADGDNIGFIQAEIKRLNQIIEDLFRVTHPRPLMTSPERPEQILERSLRCLGDLASNRSIEIIRKMPGSVPPVPVDADQIQQVMINLIKNAIEAMEPGGRLTLSTGTRPGRPGEEPWITMTVADTGAGMTPEVRKRLFEPFFTRKASGTGLGLYICHGIVERHGGLLRIDSVEGEGSSFTVELPRTPVSNGGAQ
ncbi:MAG: two-component system, NtrC family, sensor histidine kinase HydH, partial [bacterium]